MPVSGPIIKSLLEAHGEGTYIWVGRRGPLTCSGVQGIFRRLFRRAGIGTYKSGPHALRHTFATHYIAAGGSAFALSGILGHQHVGTTQIYVTLAQAHIKTEHAKYSPLHTMGLLQM